MYSTSKLPQICRTFSCALSSLSALSTPMDAVRPTIWKYSRNECETYFCHVPCEVCPLGKHLPLMLMLGYPTPLLSSRCFITLHSGHWWYFLYRSTSITSMWYAYPAWIRVQLPSHVNECKVYADDCCRLTVNSLGWLSRAEKRLQSVFELISIVAKSCKDWVSVICIRVYPDFDYKCLICTLALVPAVNPNLSLLLSSNW